MGGVVNRESSVSKKPNFWTKIVCFFACKGVHILPLMESGLDTPCSRCGRTRYIG